VLVIDSKSGSVVFQGRYVAPPDHVMLTAESGQPMRLRCSVPDLSASISSKAATDPTRIAPHAYVWTGRSPDTCAVVSPDGSSQWCGLPESHPIHQSSASARLGSVSG
jgi:hypothetical protein